ncbi:MAG TPA: ATP-dependent DNA helicase [Fimbriimonas sp.]|nr:ATP-dependent DNA helicase [Fimbriimonas sp.]
MPSPQELIEEAFSSLSSKSGFTARPAQIQLALLLSDLIESKSSGLFEAPTGLGKSLAALVPAVAHAVLNKRRTVIATYTNVLAEQYWRKDLPLALSLFEGTRPKAQLLMGRQRYACLISVAGHAPELRAPLAHAEIGHETEFKRLARLPIRQANQLWQQVAVPSVCPGRFCPDYNECFYYSARRKAEAAEIVITNHSVVIQDAVMKNSEEGGAGLLGDYDFLVVDEAHDFPAAAQNGLEFELTSGKLSALASVGQRLYSILSQAAQACGDQERWLTVCTGFQGEIHECQQELMMLGMQMADPGILTASPSDLMDHPHVSRNRTTLSMRDAQLVAKKIEQATGRFDMAVKDALDRWKAVDPEKANRAEESARNYRLYIREFGYGANALFSPRGVSVTHAGREGQDPKLRLDVIGLAEPLREMIWDRVPHACVSATAALDSSFDFYRRVTGVKPLFEEILPSPFDHPTQAALYLPKDGAIPDPAIARKEGREESYYRALARELSEIIVACEGRTLALFHSRKEMEGVYAFMSLPPELPLLIQARQNVAAIGEKFVAIDNSSLFGLRSFWTGFDAPGETLSCVVLVRIPFETPMEPPQIARLAHMQQQGLDPFMEHTLPVAKMMMRQGAGRLLRRVSDRGVIALLDPRVKSKRYGEEILNNLPTGMRTFDDIRDAVGFVGLSTSLF